MPVVAHVFEHNVAFTRGPVLLARDSRFNDEGRHGQQVGRLERRLRRDRTAPQDPSLAGIRSAAPFFEKVLVAPCPGGLKELTAKHPHPQGFVEVDLRFDGDTVSGTVKTPVPGTFTYGGRTQPLQPGENRII